jgi:glyceraldehyde-3-phosphate dehydrogenase (NADP+)
MPELSPKLDTIFPAKLPPELAALLPIEQSEYLLDGEILSWSGPSQKVYSPVGLQTDKEFEKVYLGHCPAMDQATALLALASARKAWNNGRGVWPTLPVEKRIEQVVKFISGMQACRSEMVALLMLEIGKSMADAAKEFDRTIEYMRDTVEALKELDRNSSRFAIESGIIAQSRRSPLGVTLCMGPFNYPLNETFTTLIPALIMGNTVVFKPPRFGILLYKALLPLFRDCFPAGVINTLYGSGKEVVGPLMSSGQIDVLAFIGSHGVANTLKKQHPAPHRLRCILGLGAKNPAIVLPDADLDLVIPEAVAGALSFNGQRCTALKIFFVHSSIAPEFLERFSKAISELKYGMPWEKGISLTPLPETDKPQYFEAMVKDAVAKGAEVVNPNGGQWHQTFYYPALVYPVKEGMQLWSEEQFGPVIPVVPFDDIEEPIRYIVHSEFGQQLSLFGQDPEQLAHLVDPLVNQVCRININSQCQRGPDVFPFGGRKGSAEGTLSVSDALRSFSIRTLVAAKQTEPNQAILTDIVRNRRSAFLSSDYIF